jgi:hypothetical protein
MNVRDLMAIDVHTHAEVSSRIPDDPWWQAYIICVADCSVSQVSR